jgi:signal peptidase I
MSKQEISESEIVERTSVAAEDSQKRQFALFGEIRTWGRDIFFAALTAVLIVVFVVQPVKVEGTSMQPRLTDQERIFVNKFIYHFSGVDRGDIVVFWYPRDETKSLIKRIIGLPGETVEIQSGVVVVDNEPLVEPYLEPRFIDQLSFGPVLVPDGSYFVLGDHRDSSNDSRNWGPVPVTKIFGKAFLRYWPISKFGLID